MDNATYAGLSRQAPQALSAPGLHPDWTAIQAIPEHGRCQTCDLPSWSVATSYTIPGLRGWVCSIICAECGLFGDRLCRWCGLRLDSKASRFCGDRCRRQSNRVPFGNGQRLLRFLLVHSPGLFRQITRSERLRCLHCKSQLRDKRSDAKFCDDACRKAFRRAELVRTSSKNGIIPDSSPVESTGYGSCNPRVKSELNAAVAANYLGQKTSGCDGVPK
jgi:hypothetical protein